MHRKYLFLTVLSACCACAQTSEPLQYELGAVFGYGIYHNGTILSPEGTVDAGIGNRFVAAIILGVDFSKYVSGELTFLYHDGHPFLEGQGVKVDIQGNSWALTSGLLFHFKDGTHRFRPFLTGGVGAKEYIIAGPEPYPQPIPQIASLTDNDVWKVAFVVGGEIPHPPQSDFARRDSGLPHDVSADADCSRATQHRARNLPAVHTVIRRELYILSQR